MDEVMVGRAVLVGLCDFLESRDWLAYVEGDKLLVQVAIAVVATVRVEAGVVLVKLVCRGTYELDHNGFGLHDPDVFDRVHALLLYHRR